MPERKASDSAAGAAVSASMQGGVNVVPPGSITLYDDQGHALNVQATEADYWLQKGFRREPHDLKGMTEELKAMFKAAEQAVLHYAIHAEETDALDGSDGGVMQQAQIAMNELLAAYGRLHMSANIAKPVDNGAEPVRIRENGLELLVDPNQVDPESRKPLDLTKETDPARLPEALKQQRAKLAMDDANVPDELRPRHLRNNPDVEGLIP